MGKKVGKKGNDEEKILDLIVQYNEKYNEEYAGWFNENHQDQYGLEYKKQVEDHNIDLLHNDVLKACGLKPGEIPSAEERETALKRAESKWNTQANGIYPDKAEEARKHLGNLEMYRRILKDDGAVEALNEYGLYIISEKASDKDADDFFRIISLSQQVKACDVNFYFDVVRQGELLNDVRSEICKRYSVKKGDRERPRKYFEESDKEAALEASASISMDVLKNIFRAQHSLREIVKERGRVIGDAEMRACSECATSNLADFLSLSECRDADELRFHVEQRQAELSRRTMELSHHLDKPLDVYNDIMNVIKSKDFDKKYDSYRAILRCPEYLPYMVTLDRVTPAAVNMLSTQYGYYSGTNSFTNDYLTKVAPAMDVDLSGVEKIVQEAKKHSEDDIETQLERMKPAPLSGAATVRMWISLLPFAIVWLGYRAVDIVIRYIKYAALLLIPAGAAGAVKFFEQNIRIAHNDPDISFYRYLMMLDKTSRIYSEAAAGIVLLIWIFICCSMFRSFAQLPAMYDLKGMRNSFKFTYLSVRRYYSYKTQKAEKT